MTDSDAAPAASEAFGARQPSKSKAGYALFVARSTYRQRRMIDAAGLLPILGALLFALPLLWLGDGTPEGQGGQGAGARTSHVMIYVFVVWGGLTILSAVITRGLHSVAGAGDGDPPKHEDPDNGGEASQAGKDAPHDGGGARVR